MKTSLPVRGDAPLLEVDDLHVEFDTPDGAMKAVNGVSYRVVAGQTLGVVGESGCGKSVTAMSILRLLPSPPSRVVRGAIRWRGVDLLRLLEPAMREIRGNRISMVFQEPMTALNPVMSIGQQLGETLRLHEGLDAAQAHERAIDLLRLVQIADPASRVKAYPHQLSGGMRQRVMIAMALACRPEVLIADEPTTALDVTIQAQVLALLQSLQREMGMGIVLITHNLGVVAEVCDSVVVMYAGRKVEEAPVAELFDRPLHPYTRALMRSMPTMTGQAARSGTRLHEIPGTVPALHELGRGCSFAPRCGHAADICRQEQPPLLPGDVEGHWVACFRPGETDPGEGPASGSAAKQPLESQT